MVIDMHLHRLKGKKPNMCNFLCVFGLDFFIYPPGQHSSSWIFMPSCYWYMLIRNDYLICLWSTANQSDALCLRCTNGWNIIIKYMFWAMDILITGNDCNSNISGVPWINLMLCQMCTNCWYIIIKNMFLYMSILNILETRQKNVVRYQLSYFEYLILFYFVGCKITIIHTCKNSAISCFYRIIMTLWLDCSPYYNYKRIIWATSVVELLSVWESLLSSPLMFVIMIQMAFAQHHNLISMVYWM